MHKILFTCLALALLMFGCRKDYDIATEKEISVIPVINVEAMISGTVIGSAGTGIADATVTVGGNVVTSNQKGKFWLSKKLFNKNGTLIKVTKNGYFSAFRFVYPSLGAISKTDIVLLPKQQSGTFQSVMGGEFTFAKAKVRIPANAVTDPAGMPYTGEVRVYGYWLNPTAASTYQTMPGDLRAEDAQRAARLLRTFGMIRVELETPSGMPLNIGLEKKTSIATEIPVSLRAAAPATIPLWHFDEKSGYWKEEGSAKNSNGWYEGEVSHFSFWNCDVPADYTLLRGILKNKDKSLLGNLKITINSQNYGSTDGYANSDGTFGGFIPANEALTLQVADVCGVVILTKNIGPFNSEANLGEVIVNSTLNYVKISGKLVDCDSNALPNGIAVIAFDQHSEEYLTVADNDGMFQSVVPICSSISNCTVEGYDSKNLWKSVPLEQQINGNNDTDVGTLLVCSGIDEYISFRVDGQEHLYLQQLNFSGFSNNIVIEGKLGPDSIAFRLSATMFVSNQKATVSFISSKYVINGAYKTYFCEYCPNCNCKPSDVQELVFSNFPTQLGEYAIGKASGSIMNKSKVSVPFSLDFKIKL